MPGLDEIADRLRDRLVREAGSDDAAPARDRIATLVAREAALLDSDERERLRCLVLERTLGLGPLEPLLADPTVDEVLVNGVGPGKVWVERHGRLEPTDVAFADEAELRHAVERILAPLGRRVDEAQPFVDARLPDGSRVNAIVPPLAVDGPALTIRRFRAAGFSVADLAEAGSLDTTARELLERAVRARLNILISGGTGSGKTTTLNALSELAGVDERIVTIEDAAELRLRRPHVVRLEARPPGLDGRGAVPIRALVRNALRMRPDRIVVGEVRGGEALDMVAAMSSGHAGALSTVHAGSPAQALRRVETLVLMADVDLPVAAVRQQIAGALDLVAHQERDGDGARRVVAIAEVVEDPLRGVAARRLYERRHGGRPVWRASADPGRRARLEGAKPL